MHEEGSSSLLIGEQKIGIFSKGFCFTINVNLERLHSKLDAGVSENTIPKVPPSEPQGSGTVEIHGADHRLARCNDAYWNL